MHFYPSLTVEGIMEMPANQVETLWLGITQIEAQQTLVQYAGHMWPYRDKKERAKAHRDLHKLAYPDLYKRVVYLTPEDVMRNLNGGSS